jgi:glycosyltransferase involved in cell wall biosynthesis
MTDQSEFGETTLVHDYLNQRGGAERVVLEMSNLWPEAPIYTSLYRPASTFDEFSDRDVRTTWLDRLPVDRRFRALFPLYPTAFRSIGPLDADVVISSSSGWAHAVRTSARAYHVVYCHTPARWLWGEYLRRPTGRRLMDVGAPLLRRWDAKAAGRADLYIANSEEIQRRIKRAYGLTASVVYPPVNVERFTPRERGERLLSVTRLLAHKRIDLLIQVANQLGIGLDIVGTGPALSSLQALAGPTVTLHGRLDDDAVTQLFESCRAYCLPGPEDFGIAPIEAQAAGKPVIAFATGGALETVTRGVSGVFFDRQDVTSVIDAISRCDRLDTSPGQIAALAARFSVESFRRSLMETISAGMEVRNPRYSR